MGDKFLHGPAQRRFAEEDHPVETLLPNRAHEAFSIRIQIRRTRRQMQWFHSGAAQHLPELLAESADHWCAKIQSHCNGLLIVRTKRLAYAFKFGERAGRCSGSTRALRNICRNCSLNQQTTGAQKSSLTVTAF